MGSIWGNNIKVSLFGESHGEGIGVVIDGLPEGENLDWDAIRAHMKRRAPGGLPWSTKRAEPDEVEILSGIYKGKITGAPLCGIIRNTDIRSSDYDALREKPRPGHADLTAAARYKGMNDPRGGGHFSARIMAPLTFAGAVCMQILEKREIQIRSHIYEVGGIKDTPYNMLTLPEYTGFLPFPVLDREKGKEMMAYIETVKEQGDSTGGIVECLAAGFPAGLGNPIFGNIESRLSSLLFSIPAVKGVEFGSGFAVSGRRGSENNDSPQITKEGIRLLSNHGGGIEGGISNGMPIVFRCAFKPTPSIAAEQKTINIKTMKNDILCIKGRHDPCVVPRAVPIVESAAAIGLLDVLME